MKSILGKFFRVDDQNMITESQPMVVPPPIPKIECAFEVQKRSLIGLVARKMAKHLNVDQKVQDNIIYLPFSSETFVENRAIESEYLLFLAERMVTWIKDQEDVYWKIRESVLLDRYHGCFLSVYEQVKDEIDSIFRPVQMEPERERSPAEADVEWKIYRDVMYAVTQRKFLLIEKHEVDKYREGTQLCEVAIKQRSDISNAREIAKQDLLQAGIHQSQVMSFLLIISEAITNILKHANQGKMTIVKNEEKVHVIVEDDGPGFDLKLLPNTALMAGYSTKKSLGQGFTLMLKMAEEVLLFTSSNGSTIILVFSEKVGTKHEGVV